MTSPAARAPHIHFETRHDRASVFQITRERVSAAVRRHSLPVKIRTTLGHDLADLSLLGRATAFVSSVDVVIDPRFPLRTLATAAPRLRWIHITGAGIEPLLPLDWLPRGVTLTNNSGVHVPKVAEFATMALLMLNAGIPRMVSNQARSEWAQIFTPSIAGKTVLIVGLGDMGGTAARQAKRLGMRVIGISRSARPHRHADEVLEPRHLARAARRADFVLVAAPLTHETRHLVDRGVLAAAKPGVGLINVGRAGVVDYDALRDALASGVVGCAILDVFDPEPLPASSPLWRTPNLILMPHCSSDDLDLYMPRTLDLVFQNMRRLIAGRPLKNVVDRQRGY